MHDGHDGAMAAQAGQVGAHRMDRDDLLGVLPLQQLFRFLAEDQQGGQPLAAVSR